MAVDLAAELVRRPALRSRNAVGYLTARAWRAEARREQIAALKAEKRGDDMPLAEVAAVDVAALLAKFTPPPAGAVVTCVPCGHSRRPDSFARRLAEGVAALLDLPFVQVWADRYCSGVSHPKEFAKLPPLEWLAMPPGYTLVVDDVATSGWHLEEAVGALRAHGLPALGVAWIGGEVQSDGDSQADEADLSDGPPSPFGRSVWRPGR